MTSSIDTWVDDRVESPKNIERHKVLSEYDRKIKSLKTRQKFISAAFFIIKLLLIIILCLVIYQGLSKKKDSSHTPVGIEDLTCDVTETSGTYNVSVEKGETINDITYKIVTIGGYTTLKEESRAERIGNNNKIDTTIYVLTIKNTDDYLMSGFSNNTFTVIKYSYFGDGPFSDSEISYYKDLAASYFTMTKYKALRYDDYEEFTTFDENMSTSLESSIFTK